MISLQLVRDRKNQKKQFLSAKYTMLTVITILYTLTVIIFELKLPFSSSFALTIFLDKMFKIKRYPQDKNNREITNG